VTPRLRFTALIGADIGSALGSRVSLVAIPWLVLSLHGSAPEMGYAAAAEMVPYLITSMFLTPVADWFGLRRTSVTCDAGSALAIGAIAALPHTGMLALFGLIAVAGALRGVGDRVKHVLLKPAAQAAGLPMIKVTSWYEGLTRLVTLLGAPLGGLLIASCGARGAVWVDAASFAGCASAVLIAVAPSLSGRAGPREPYRQALLGGIRYLRSDRVLSLMLATVFFLNFFANAATVVFIPLWARDVLHSPEALGLTLGAFAAGALGGTIGFTRLAPRLRQYPAFLIGALVSCAPRLFVLSWSSSLPLVLAVSLSAGIGLAAVNPVLGVAMYERIPDALQTRVIGLSTTLAFLGIPIGAVIGGWAVSGFGLRPSLLGAAGLSLLIGLVPFAALGAVDLPAPQPRVAPGEEPPVVVATPAEEPTAALSAPAGPAAEPS